jgi:hypothetical protein
MNKIEENQRSEQKKIDIARMLDDVREREAISAPYHKLGNDI